MTVRLDFLNGLSPNAYKYYWESADDIYKKYKPFYRDLAIIKSTSEIKGGYEKSTSVIGADQMADMANYGVASEDHPIEGYPVYWTIKQKAKKIRMPREVIRDMKHRADDWLKQYVKSVVPMMVEKTKEVIVADVYNYGGYTSGNAIFNQDDGDLSLTTGYTSFCYDGKPLFALSGNNHTRKDASTFYNATAITTASASGQSNGINYANALTMWNLLTSTNAKMENGAQFDNSSGVSVVCHKSAEMDWKVIQNSTLNPDNAENATNPLNGMFDKIIGNPYITTATQSVMFRKEGLIAYFGDPIFNFYETNDPDAVYFKVVLDYAIAPKAACTFLANNAPTSA